MKNRKSFETIGEAGQIFAIGFDLTDKDDRLQDAEVRTYIKFNDISTKEIMTVLGDVIGRFIRDAAKSEKTRSAMLKTLVANVVESMDGDEEQKEKQEDDDVSIKDISDTLNSIKSLLEVMKMVKEE